MDRSAVLDTLKRHEPELRSLGIARLSLFGSIARDEAREGSDIDLAAVFDPSANMDFFRFATLARRLEDMLARKVDLLGEPPRKPSIKASLERDRVHVF